MLPDTLYMLQNLRVFHTMRTFQYMHKNSHKAYKMLNVRHYYNNNDLEMGGIILYHAVGVAHCYSQFSPQIINFIGIYL